MADGINWGLLQQAPNPAQGFMSGIQQGMMMKSAQDSQAFQQEQRDAWREDREFQKQQRIDAQMAQEQQQAQLAEALDLFMEDPTSQNAFRLKQMMPKDLRDSVDNFQDSVGKEEMQRRRGVINPIMHMLKNGRKDLVAAQLEKAAKNFADEPDMMNTLQAVATLVDADEMDAAFRVARGAYAMGDPEGYKTIMEGIKAGADAEKVEIANMKAMREAASETLRNKALPGPVRSDYKESMKKIKKDREDFKKVNELLDSIPKENIGGVLQTSAQQLEDWWTGGTEEVKSFKQQLSAFKLVDMLKTKPPGALSEGELAVLQAGVPAEGASAEVIQDYLDAAKATIESSYAYERVKLKWIDTFGDINATRTGELEVFGEPVQQSENLDDFVERMGERLRQFSPVRTDRSIAPESVQMEEKAAEAEAPDEQAVGVSTEGSVPASGQENLKDFVDGLF